MKQSRPKIRGRITSLNIDPTLSYWENIKAISRWGTAEQRFYLGYAAVWAQNIRDKEIERLTNIAPHSLGEYRVNQSLRNIDTFYQAFGITEGDMFLAPEGRVVIW